VALALCGHAYCAARTHACRATCALPDCLLMRGSCPHLRSGASPWRRVGSGGARMARMQGSQQASWSECMQEFKKEQGIDLSGDRLAVQRLREAAEKAKCELSSTMTTEINLPFITADAAGPKHLLMNVSRAQYEAMTASLLERTKQPCLDCMKDAGVHLWPLSSSLWSQPSNLQPPQARSRAGGSDCCALLEQPS
jgi:hypothetical protein